MTGTEPLLPPGVTPTATETALPAPAAPTTRHLTLAVLALATGGFAIGTTEFVSMGSSRSWRAAST